VNIDALLAGRALREIRGSQMKSPPELTVGAIKFFLECALLVK